MQPLFSAQEDDGDAAGHHGQPHEDERTGPEDLGHDTTPSACYAEPLAPLGAASAAPSDAD